MFDPEVLARSGTVLLDDARPGASSSSLCFSDPSRVLTASTPEEVDPLLEEIEAVSASGDYVAGYLSYEAGYPLVDLPATPTEAPLAWFGVYEEPMSVAPPEVDRGLAQIQGTSSVHDVQFGVSRENYIDAIEQVRAHIGEGNVYQINYTAPVHFRLDGDPRILYRRLRQRQHVPYGAYLHLGDRHILSCSPELFFRRREDRVTTQPMKGTIRRGRTRDEDRALQESLAADSKNRAENLMIVDLLRNDLSVCCRPGSVQVPELYATDTYETVTQMTSTVEGELRPDQGLSEVLRALFPCGSVTGAPKRRAMQIIRELEGGPRGVYCGAIGMAGPETATFNVVIRSAVVDADGTGQMGVGSGIVWDSDPESEYDECQLKTQFLMPSTASSQIADPDHDPRLIETMRYDGLRLPLFDQHVERLAESAAYFDYAFDAADFREQVQQAVTDAGSDAVQKVRATLDRWGDVEVSVSPLQERAEPWRCMVAPTRVDRNDPYFYHKTTHRHVYDQALSTARDEGYDEAILLNQDGEVTEGAHTNLFIRDGDRLLTPPVDSGLLGGVYRAYVLDAEEDAQEQVLTLDDLRQADALFCCNALRGWKKAVLEEDPVPVQ